MHKIIIDLNIPSINGMVSADSKLIRGCPKRVAIMLAIIMPRCACASEVYGSVFVCLCVCLCRLLQLLKDESSASKSFYRLLVMFTWILIREFAK